jgi:Skp family chaperone for outer membrane proteins
VNKFLLSASAVAALSLAGFTVNALAQPAKPAAPAAASTAPHKVALIDMAYVFKNYEKFTNLREDLKTEVMQSEEEAKQKAEVLQKLQKEMKTFAEGSPEFTQREQALTRMAADFETFRKGAQRDFLKKESQIYHTVYMDVADMVAKYANHFQYTLVIRFNREDLDTENAQKLIEGMNRQVVFHREEDDITEAVVDTLNKKLKNAGGAAAKPAAPATRPATATSTRPTSQK